MEDMTQWANDSLETILKESTGKRAGTGERWEKNGLILDIVAGSSGMKTRNIKVVMNTNALEWNTSLLNENCKFNEQNESAVIKRLRKRMANAVSRFMAMAEWRRDNDTDRLPLWAFAVHPAYFLMHREWGLEKDQVYKDLDPWGSGYHQTDETPLIQGSAKAEGERIIGWRQSRRKITSGIEANDKDRLGIAAVATSNSHKERVSIHIAGEFPATISNAVAKKPLGTMIHTGDPMMDGIRIRKCVRLENQHNGHISDGLRLDLEHSQVRMEPIPEKYDTGWNAVKKSFKGLP